MPRMDGTGPSGKGPGTGRGLGPCRKRSIEEDTIRTGRGPGRRQMPGRGQGQGRPSGGGQGSGKGRQGR